MVEAFHALLAYLSLGGRAKSCNLLNLSNLRGEPRLELGAIPRTSREPAVNDDLGFMSRLTGRCARCDCRYPLHIHASAFPKTTGDGKIQTVGPWFAPLTAFRSKTKPGQLSSSSGLRATRRDCGGRL